MRGGLAPVCLAALSHSGPISLPHISGTLFKNSLFFWVRAIFVMLNVMREPFILTRAESVSSPRGPNLPVFYLAESDRRIPKHVVDIWTIMRKFVVLEPAVQSTIGDICLNRTPTMNDKGRGTNRWAGVFVSMGKLNIWQWRFCDENVKEKRSFNYGH